MPLDSVRIVRFGVFEVDLRSGELRKRGVRVVLQQQPFRILIRLLEQPGELVTRDALRQDLWAADTFVDFEHGVNAAIKRLREALGDSADTPRFIETLPRRGYRFIAPVTASPDDERAEPSRGRAPNRSPRQWAAVVAWALITIGLVGFSAVRNRHAVALTDRDTIVVADFVNRTPDSVFDGTLRQALTIALQQSPFLSVVSHERLRRIVREMRRPDDALVVGGIAREACQRLGARLSVNGTIAAFGRQHLITLEAVDCATGDTLASGRADAPDREHVLTALDTAATLLRERIGEARPVLQRFNRPLREATTGSLEALRAFDTAEQIREQQGEARAEAHYLRAIELDPEFALAYARAASISMNLGRPPEQVRHFIQEATQRREHVTERERLYIDYRACTVKPDRFECGLRVAEAWQRIYPRDWEPYQALCMTYTMPLGEFDRALPNCVEAVRLNPTHSMTIITLLAAHMGLNHFDEAKRVADAALAHGVDTDNLREARYDIAFIAEDARAMALERSAANADRERPAFLIHEAEAAAFRGRFSEARVLRTRAETLNGGRDPRFDAASHWHGASFEGLAGIEVKVPLDSPETAAAGQALMLALARHDWKRARALLDVRIGAGALFQRIEIPARVLISVASGDREAVQRLPAPQPIDLALSGEYRPVYLRGLAYLRAGDGAKAAAEFQRIIDHRGVAPISPLYPLSHVQHARACAMRGDVPRARRSYEKFFQLWKDADPDVPIFLQAKAEFAQLRAR